MFTVKDLCVVVRVKTATQHTFALDVELFYSRGFIGLPPQVLFLLLVFIIVCICLYLFSSVDSHRFTHNAKCLICIFLRISHKGTANESFKQEISEQMPESLPWQPCRPGGSIPPLCVQKQPERPLRIHSRSGRS